MSFDTPLFFVFFVIVFALARTFPRVGGVVLLAASVLFYSAAGTLDMALVLAMVAANYAISFGVARDRRWLILAVVANLAVLAFFKYRHFFFPEMAAAVENFYQGDILIPIGISFYTFQAISYQADLASGRCERIRKPWRFALYILLFPQIIAGPIVRAEQLVPQVGWAFAGRLRRKRIWSVGLGLCLIGLIKKIVIADSLAPIVDAVFHAGPGDVYSAWMGATLFAFQIYFDFSGYSDIAIGTGYLLGIRLPLNFRQPYLSKDPQDFWRRWHITLSTWIRDYLYIPLGGRRSGGYARQFAVLLVAMGFAGLWHGAAWTFILWGLFWGLYIALWRVGGRFAMRLGPGQWLAHMVVVVTLWVFFRAPGIGDAFDYLGGMFGAPAGSYLLAGDAYGMMLGVAGVVLLMASQLLEARITDAQGLIRIRRIEGPVVWGVLAGLSLWWVVIPKFSGNPFIYFRF